MSLYLKYLLRLMLHLPRLLCLPLRCLHSLLLLKLPLCLLLLLLLLRLHKRRLHCLRLL